MINVRPSRERGGADHGWLDTRFTFSFADYHDSRHMGFRHLRVINEDRVQPSRGFPTHPHRNMEIITYILAGSLEHKDSTGGQSIIREGDVQRMTAGRGVTHSEFNPSTTEPVHLLQIWIFPEKTGLDPGYAQKNYPDDQKRNRLKLIVSHDGRDESLTIHQDVSLYASILDAGKTLELPIASGRSAWVQIARGEVRLNGTVLSAGDGAAVSEESLLKIEGVEPAEFLVFDLA